jgi:hypothetical protein
MGAFMAPAAVDQKGGAEWRAVKRVAGPWDGDSVGTGRRRGRRLT